MEPKLTSYEIIRASHRVGEIMDITAHFETRSEEIEQLDKEALALLEALGTETPGKLEALRAVCTHLDSEAKMLREEEKRLAGRRRGRETAIERVRSYAAGILSARRQAGMEPKIKTESGTFWLASSTRLEGPKSVDRWKEAGWSRTEIKPDKVAAKAALEDGAQVDGFELVSSESVRWR